MLHRELLDTIASLDKSPFGPGANAQALALVAGGLGPTLEGATSSPQDTFLLLWRCVSAARSGNTDDAAAGEFVATLPTGVPKGARPTDIVIKEMLGSAKKRVTALGYAFTAAGGTVAQLAAAAARGVDVLVICDRGTGGKTEIENAWPTFVPKPVIYVNAETNDEMHKMHCKMLVVDDKDLLVTSANFTYHGMLGNIEFGVRLRDAASSKAANSFVQHLIETKAVVTS